MWGRRAWVMTVLALALAATAACHRDDHDRARGHGRPTASATRSDAGAPHPTPADARGSPPAVVADGTLDPTLLTGATFLDLPDADGRGLGAAIDVWMVRDLGDASGNTRLFTLEMIVRGAGGTLVVPFAGPGFGADGEASDTPAGTRLTLAPVDGDDVRDHPYGDLAPPLPGRPPLLYAFHFHIPGGNDVIAVTREDDNLNVSYFWQDEGTRADAWESLGTVRLAPDAVVTAR
ncbi:MAG: hypothetical protein H6709_18650 [Kofleriaceae bacterium]|nr:hypothetical protein [Kofleriaceae bacterium]